MNLEELLKERQEQFTQLEKTRVELLDQLNRCERNLIAVQASIATIELIMKGSPNESTQ